MNLHDMVILVNGHEALSWLVEKAQRRLREELDKLEVTLNLKKTKVVDLEKGETFCFLGFEYRLVRNSADKMVLMRPRKKKVQELIDKVRTLLRQNRDKTVYQVVASLNPILRGWVAYYRIGHSSRVFGFIRQWVERKVRRFVRKAHGRKGFSWNEWSSEVVYGTWGLYMTTEFDTVK
jgi:RNA-directed DNA polymerase